jgi:hypothetical protein
MHSSTHYRARAVAISCALSAALAACTSSGGRPTSAVPAARSSSAASPSASASVLTPTAVTTAPTPSGTPTPASVSAAPTPSSVRTTPTPSSRYPLHTNIVATTFWVGEIFDPQAADGSQVISTYDDHWLANYGGCDGVQSSSGCQTERRTAANGYFPTTMTPRQNPFYLDLPFDDVNDAQAAASRASVVPWAHEPAYVGLLASPDRSLMKNRWVAIKLGGSVCYGQIEDAGPGDYNDAAYVFGSNDARPANQRYGGAGMDVSPALNGCLGFTELNGDTDKVSWWFVDSAAVPPGPWTKIITS